MQIAYNLLYTVALIVACVFSFLVLATGKGDAMGGGTSVRTSFKGKASFEDIVSRYTLYIGIGFMVMMIILVVLGNYMLKHGLLK